ncbi:MAG: PilZ domain-containing protein [Mariprofundales bacterium]|nr:PilZ domain-containing protein [Mariprofundales bacterium]
MAGEDNSGRQFTRICMPTEIEITQDDTTISGTVSDISMNGVSVDGNASALTTDRECDLKILLGEGEEQIEIKAVGRVVRADAKLIAIAFVQVYLESMPYLRNLILYNAAETEQVEQEFASHMGIK